MQPNSHDIPDRCPDCERRLVRENDFLICAECEFVIDLKESPDEREGR